MRRKIKGSATRILSDILLPNTILDILYTNFLPDIAILNFIIEDFIVTIQESINEAILKGKPSIKSK